METPRNAINAKWTPVVQWNRSRTDLVDKFKLLIDEYNKALDVDTFFAKLKAFADPN